MTYNFGTRQEENTSFQKQERVFYVFGNSQKITTMCIIGCIFYAEVDRTSVIDALDDIFLKIQKKLVFVIDDL